MDQSLLDFESALLANYFNRYNFNAGGCAKAAYELYKYFSKYKEVKVKGAMVVNWCSFIKDKQSLTNMTNTRPLRSTIQYCNHVVLVIEHKNEQYVIDVIEGIKTKKEYIAESQELNRRTITGYLKPRLLNKLSKSPEGWNERFNVYNLKHLRTFLKGYDFNG